MMQSKMAFLVEEAHLIVEELQPILKHHTHITNLMEEHQNRTHLTSSLPSGGQSENMSKPCSHHPSQVLFGDMLAQITQPYFSSSQNTCKWLCILS